MIPQRGLDPSNKPADCFMELQKSFGALAYSIFNGSITKRSYYTSSTAYGLMLAFNGTVLAASQINPNQFFLGMDTEILQRKASLLTGLDTYASGLFFRANIGATNIAAFTHTCMFYGLYDVILSIDTETKTIQAKY